MNYEDRLQRKIAPDAVMLTLVRAGCLLVAYELIKSEVVDKVHSFFWRGFENGRDLYDEARYHQAVLARVPRSRFRASCSWLVELNALTPEQVDTLEAIYRHRNEVAHELPKLLVDPDFEVRTDLLRDALECIRRLGIFWGSIAADTNPDFDEHEVDYDNIKSGSFLLMEYLVALCALDRDDENQARESVEKTSTVDSEPSLFQDAGRYEEADSE